jgi:hypothetical protein
MMSILEMCFATFAIAYFIYNIASLQNTHCLLQALLTVYQSNPERQSSQANRHRVCIVSGIVAACAGLPGDRG